MTRILVFGTSIDHGFWDKKGGWVQRLRRELDSYSLENESDYSIYNLSISGDTSKGIRNRIRDEIEPRDNSEELHVYLELGGGNDSLKELETKENQVPTDEYRDNLEACIEIAEEYADEVVLFSTVPVDEEEAFPIPWRETHGYTNEEKKAYTEILKEVADQRGLLFVNFFETVERESWNEKLEDGVHPDTQGHREMHRIALERLIGEGLIPDVK